MSCVIGDSFLPCAERARTLRAAMSEALCRSLSELLGPDHPALAGVSGVSSSSQAEVIDPLVFGAYFDLLANQDPSTHGASSPRDDALDWLARRFLSQEKPVLLGGPPAITTLSAAFYGAGEIARWKRWLDMEPENALALSDLPAADFEQEVGKVGQALTALEAAAPELYAEVVTITREILLLRPDGAQRMSFRGASSFALWGASAFNQLEHQHWVEYFKTLVHESAHSLLFALARDEPLILNALGERYGSPLRSDLRPMDGIFHAAFVSAREAYALEGYLDFLGLQSDEEVKAWGPKVEAELNSSVLAFWDCCDEIEKNGLLSPLGQKILEDATAWMSSRFQVHELASGPD